MASHCFILWMSSQCKERSKMFKFPRKDSSRVEMNSEFLHSQNEILAILVLFFSSSFLSSPSFLSPTFFLLLCCVLFPPSFILPGNFPKLESNDPWPRGPSREDSNTAASENSASVNSLFSCSTSTRD